MNIEQEFVKEVEQESQAEVIINKIRQLRDTKDKWEIFIKLKQLAPEIAKLNESDRILVQSFAKQALSLSSSDMKAIKIEVNKFYHQNLVKRHDMGLDLDGEARIKPTDKNLSIIFSTDKEIRSSFCKNDFSNEISVPVGGAWHIRESNFPRTIKNDDPNQIKLYLINKYNVEYKIKQIEESIQTLSVINHYDPLLDYLEPLQWNGTPKAETWLIDYCGAEDNAYTRWVSKTMLVAAVARAYVPGIKYDHVVVLSGDQSVQKSTLIESLASEQFFNEIPLTASDKETVQKMIGSWIIEVPEGLSFRKKEINELKNFITNKKNKERFAYERYMETYARRSIFIMTINPTSLGYLADPTGNRRFLPVRINGDINIKAIKENRDQLFAEAKHLFKNGYRIFLDKNDSNDINIINILAKEHEIAETKDAWENDIILWLIGKKMNGQATYMEIPPVISCADVYVNCIGGQLANYIQQSHGQRIGNILTKLGCKYTSERIDGKENPLKGYYTYDAIRALKQSFVDESLKQIDRMSLVTSPDDIVWDE